MNLVSGVIIVGGQWGQRNQEDLERCVASLKPHVDELCILDNSGSADLGAYCRSVADHYGVARWNGDFAEQRNLAEDLVRTPWYIWLDSDDELVGGENLREVVAKVHPNRHMGSLSVIYDYYQDEYGNEMCPMDRDHRVLRTGCYTWRHRVHEDAYPKNPTMRSGAVESFKVKHHKTREALEVSSKRNRAILETSISETSEIRDIMYYAHTLRNEGDLRGAVKWYQLYLARSDFEEERYVVFMAMGDCFKELGEADNARLCYMRSISIRPKWPHAYAHMGVIETSLENWDRGLEWAELADAMELPRARVAMMQSDKTMTPLQIMAKCHFQKTNRDKAAFYARKVLDLRPDATYYQTMIDLIDESRKIEAAMQDLAGKLADKTRDEKLEILRALPKGHPMTPDCLALLREAVKPGANVAILCGHTREAFDSDSVKTGIGGSEEAVIQMAKRWAALGLDVHVFCEIPKPDSWTDAHGVHWHPWQEFVPDEAWANVIVWRQPTACVLPTRSANTILWMHDVPDPMEFTDEVVAKIDRVVVLSEYHKSLLPPNVPAEKITVSRNGVDLSQFSGPRRNDPNQYIYMSCPTRGLGTLFELWPSIVERNPKAHLHVCYGFTKNYLADEANNPSKKEFRLQAMAYMESCDNITWHGRLGHQDLANLVQTCGFWLYPTVFPEISCIAAMKAQVGGAIPVCSDTAALEETVRWGRKGPIKGYAEAVLEAISQGWTNAYLDEMTSDARTVFDWDTVAAEWERDILKIPQEAMA